jgi:hypothetical protein
VVASDNVIRRIDWNEVFPWLVLFRTIPIAGSLGVLILALAGAVATPAGWLASELVIVRQSMRQANPVMAATAELNRSPFRAVFDASERSANDLVLFGAHLSGPRAIFARLTAPFQQLFSRNQGAGWFAYNLLGGAWTLAVWALVGCGITRICLLRLTRDESAGIDDAIRFATPRFSQCLLAVGSPLGAVFLLVLPALLIGLMMTFNLGLIVGSLLWFVVLLCGLLMTLLLLGMFFAWPLVIASISAESQSPLDAVTRCFSYIFQRPFHYAFYVIVSMVLGGFCWILVAQIASGTLRMAEWAGSWGANVGDRDRMSEILQRDVAPLVAPGTATLPGPMGDTTPATTPPAVTVDPQATISDAAQNDATRPVLLVAGGQILKFWNGMVSTLAVAFLYGLFWCMAAAIYLLLRKDVDEIELDEVFVDEDSRTMELPPLKTDANGIPQIQPLDDGDSPG